MYCLRTVIRRYREQNKDWLAQEWFRYYHLLWCRKTKFSQAIALSRIPRYRVNSICHACSAIFFTFAFSSLLHFYSRCCRLSFSICVAKNKEVRLWFCSQFDIRWRNFFHLPALCCCCSSTLSAASFWSLSCLSLMRICLIFTFVFPSFTFCTTMIKALAQLWSGF